MGAYTANRPLYGGGGRRTAAGETIELERHEAEPLLASGAISEGKAKGASPENKANPPSEANKGGDAPASKKGTAK